MSKLGRLYDRWKQEKRWQRIEKQWLSMNIQPKDEECTNKQYTFGITTYKERFEDYLKPLIARLNYLFPDTKIIVGVNGYYDQDAQQEYLDKINEWKTQYTNLEVFSYNEPQGLCTIWNNIVLRTKTEKLFIMNEDIAISPELRNEIESSDILNTDFGLINGSYSHYLISKEVLRKVGWFDERFPGIGYEDHDYEIRMAIHGISVKEFAFKEIKNENVTPKDWSWGDQQEVIFGKYSGPNGEHYFNKWEFSEEQKEGYTYCRIIQGYAKLKEGMETPNFHPTIDL